MNILHIALGGCLTYPDTPYGITEDTGGHIAYILGAARAQARRCDVDRVDIVTRAFDDPALGSDHRRTEQPIGAKMRILRLPTPRTDYLAKEELVAERPALADAFEDLLASMDARPDVIHAHFADAAAVVREAARRFGIPVVYTPHSLGVDKRGAMGAPMGAALAARIESERDALRRSAAVVVSSRDEAERQVEGYDVDVAGRVHRIPPGVEDATGPDGTGDARPLVDGMLDDPSRPMILAIARPVRKKNLVALARAYAADPALHERANLVILAGQRGPGIATTRETAAVIAELERIAARHPGRIALPPRHAMGTVAQMYRLAAERRGVFVNPALHEPFGLTLLEAAIAGLPVVATRAGGPSDIVATLGNGRLVDPTDDDAIAAAIRSLLDDPAGWNAASGAGLHRIGRFDWDRWADRAQMVYRRIATPARPASHAVALLACDIDGTLTGSPAGADAFRDWAARRTVSYVVATGRCISEARRVLDDWHLPQPDAFISAVGTELHVRGTDGRLHLCPDYAARLSRDWDRDAVLAALRDAGAAMQPEVEQRRWKLACFGDAAEAVRLRAVLRRAGLSARVVPSHGRLIDVLAPQGGKAAAVEAAASRLGLGLDDCIAAGDSGNDLDMLRACGRAIVVGNALPELDRLPASDRLHRTAAHNADGVMEGLVRLGLARTAVPVAVSA
ncbi:HAD-IIB family hydrolase [Jannaschia sp. LMIT008]|uniref:HAD-IIB family hydrolase n=1 Tax=Jannaschia maritima TaxID=3032585 RepID=UPI0028122C35|nr:HAD-IIB family hydrolase [Jannaschia sp. LMIT008]